MSSFTNQRIDLNLVLGKEASILEHQILESTTKHQRISVLEKFLMRKLCKTAQQTDIIDTAVQTMLQQKGIVSIRQLSEDLCISPRQFQRRFSEKVGVSPKLFSRIKRFKVVLEK
jgi:transcriptional regulator GlxA family with amidase domain